MLQPSKTDNPVYFWVNLHIKVSKMRCYSICFFINLFVCFYAKGQYTAAAVSAGKAVVIDDTASKNVKIFIPFYSNFNTNSPRNPAVKRIQSSYYFNSLGFFCQKELQIEKTLKFPLKLRLGSVAYTDQMEGKGKKSY